MIKQAVLGVGLMLSLSWACAQSCNRTNEDSGDYVQPWEFCDDDVTNKKVPKFTAYPAAGVTGLKPRLPVRFDGTDPEDSARWMEAIRATFTAGDSLFAGHYLFVVRGGCGNGCHRAVIIDLRDGAIFKPEQLDIVLANLNTLPATMCATLDIECLGTFAFRPASKLLVVAGQLGEDAVRRGFYFFKWEGNELRLVSKVDKSTNEKRQRR